MQRTKAAAKKHGDEFDRVGQLDDDNIIRAHAILDEMGGDIFGLDSRAGSR